MIETDDYERDVTCDGEGCENHFFISSSCVIKNAHIDAIGKLLGWTLVGEDGAFCPHCRHLVPKTKPRTKKLED